MQGCLIIPTLSGSLALGNSGVSGQIQSFLCFFPQPLWNTLWLFPPQHSQSKVQGSDPHKHFMTQFPRQLFPYLLQSSGCF